jgi:3-oxoadipate enol-lactonase
VLRAPVDDGLELEYEDRGAGEPVVLIHAGVCADFFAPLMDQPALAGHRLVRHHRAGYAGSGRVEGPLGIALQAAHCRALMTELGIERAHVVGHSSGACIALQLALDAPEAVRSLALLEPAKPGAPSPRQQELVETIFRPALERYTAGDRAAAVDVFMRGVCGADYRLPLEGALPGAFEQAVADADTFFGQELPAVMAWSLGPDEAARVAKPALVVRGGDSLEVYRERQALLLEWLPDAEAFVLAGATHLLQIQQPRAMAEALAGFFGRHETQGGPTPNWDPQPPSG